MRLVFVHGINNEGGSAQAICDRWLQALESALAPEQRAVLRDREIEAAFYGDALAAEAQARTATGPRLRAQGASDAAPEEAAFYRDVLTEIAQTYPERFTTDAVMAETRLVEQGAIYNNRYLIALMQVAEGVLPDRGSALLRILPQAFVYLNRRRAADAVDALVRPLLEKAPCVVVAHSLGTIVTFRLMRTLRQECPYFLTLGSPLAIKAVQGGVRLPFGRQPAVARWRNVWEPDDVVTLGRPLDDRTFGSGIENSRVANPGDDPHDVSRYLAQPAIAAELLAALAFAQQPGG